MSAHSDKSSGIMNPGALDQSNYMLVGGVRFARRAGSRTTVLSVGCCLRAVSVSRTALYIRVHAPRPPKLYEGVCE